MKDTVITLGFMLFIAWMFTPSAMSRCLPDNPSSEQRLNCAAAIYGAGSWRD